MALNSHKRETNARRFPQAHRVAGPIAFLVTASTVGLGVMATSPEARESLVASNTSSILGADLAARADRGSSVSRSDSRVDAAGLQKAFDVNLARQATLRAVKNADTRKWTTVALNLWTSPTDDARKVGVLGDRKRVLVTGRHTPERVEIVWDGKSRWVTAGYLADEKPAKEPAGVGSGSLDAACTNGSAVPSGVSPNIVAVHEAVCANFPEITTYGTFRGDGEHAQGLAVDIMTSGERGWQVAEFVRAHYAELGVSYIIYSQHIWSVERGGEGWRAMEDRGSTTANHYDHVHVTTY